MFHRDTIACKVVIISASLVTGLRVKCYSKEKTLQGFILYSNKAQAKIQSSLSVWYSTWLRLHTLPVDFPLLISPS